MKCLFYDWLASWIVQQRLALIYHSRLNQALHFNNFVVAIVLRLVRLLWLLWHQLWDLTWLQACESGGVTLKSVVVTAVIRLTRSIRYILYRKLHTRRLLLVTIRSEDQISIHSVIRRNTRWPAWVQLNWLKFDYVIFAWLLVGRCRLLLTRWV